MAIDSHMHVNSLVVDDKEKVIERINLNDEIEKVLNVGLDRETSFESVGIALSNHKFYSAIGVHPLYVKNQNFEWMENLASSEKVVAIGEIGLDYYNKDYDKQRMIFIKQIMLANELQLPVIIHANNTNYDIVEIFERYVKPKYGCVFHCFQPDVEILKYLIDNGYYISFAGRITYKNACKSLEIAKLVPNDLFLVETDSPYITPEPFRGEINKVEYIRYIIKKIAEIKEMTYKEVEDYSTRNAKRLFKKMN